MSNNRILRVQSDYSYSLADVISSVSLNNTSFPYADGLNREPNLLRIGMVRISERTTNSHTFSFNDIMLTSFTSYPMNQEGLTGKTLSVVNPHYSRTLERITK